MSLMGRDEKKLIAAGFTLIRRDDLPKPRIKFKSKDNFEWRTMSGPFDTKTARDREANNLLKISTVIEC